MFRNLIIGLSVVLFGIGCGQSLQAQPAPPPAQDQMGPPQGALADVAQPGRWPMIVPSPQGQVTIFQPQLDDFQGDHLTARTAVLVEGAPAAGGAAPQATYGAVWLDSRVQIDRTSRTVQT